MSKKFRRLNVGIQNAVLEGFEEPKVAGLSFSPNTKLVVKSKDGYKSYYDKDKRVYFTVLSTGFEPSFKEQAQTVYAHADAFFNFQVAKGIWETSEKMYLESWFRLHGRKLAEPKIQKAPKVPKAKIADAHAFDFSALSV
jgi:hypothetical protein